MNEINFFVLLSQFWSFAFLRCILEVLLTNIKRLKVMPWPSVSESKKILIKYFIWGTKHYFGQEAAKISKVKFGDWKKICWFSPGRWHVGVESTRVSNFFSTSNFDVWFFAALFQNECLVIHFKDLFHTCLEPEAQGHGMISKMCNVSSILHHKKANDQHWLSITVNSLAIFGLKLGHYVYLNYKTIISNNQLIAWLDFLIFFIVF